MRVERVGFSASMSGAVNRKQKGYPMSRSYKKYPAFGVLEPSWVRRGCKDDRESRKETMRRARHNDKIVLATMLTEDCEEYFTGHVLVKCSKRNRFVDLNGKFTHWWEDCHEENETMTVEVGVDVRMVGRKPSPEGVVFRRGEDRFVFHGNKICWYADYKVEESDIVASNPSEWFLRTMKPVQKNFSRWKGNGIFWKEEMDRFSSSDKRKILSK